MTGEFPAQWASNAEHVSSWWLLHAISKWWICNPPDTISLQVYESHPGIRLFIRDQDTIGKPKKTKRWHSTQEPRTPQKYNPIECGGVQLHQYWMTPLLYVYIYIYIYIYIYVYIYIYIYIYTSYNRAHVKNAYIYSINTELLDGNKGHQEETYININMYIEYNYWYILPSEYFSLFYLYFHLSNSFKVDLGTLFFNFHIRNLYITLSYLMGLVPLHNGAQTQHQQSNNVVWLRVQWEISSTMVTEVKQTKCTTQLNILCRLYNDAHLNIIATH